MKEILHNSISKSINNIKTWWLHISIFVVIATHFIIPQVGRISMVLLQSLVFFGTILILLRKKTRTNYFQFWQNIPQKYKVICLSLTLYFLVYTGFLLLHHDKLKFFDYPLRRLVFLLFIPFLCHHSCVNTGESTSENSTNIQTSIKLLKSALIIGGLGACTMSLYQYFGLWGSTIFSRVEGWYDRNPAEFGNLALLQGLVLFGLWRYKIKKISFKGDTNLLNLLTLLGIIGYLTASFLSGTRGGWLIFPIILFLEMYRYYINEITILKKNLIIVITIIALICGIIGIITTENSIKPRINQAIDDVVNLEKNANTSIGQRLQMWKMGLYVLQHESFTGIGASAFAPLMEQAQKTGFLYPDSNLPEHADCHQELLWNFIVGGSLLFFLWAYAFGYWWWQAFTPLNFFKRRKSNNSNSVHLLNSIVLNETICIALTFYFIMGLSVTWSMIQIRRDLFGLWFVILLWLGLMACKLEFEQKQH
jgi:O-antigen ligase